MSKNSQVIFFRLDRDAKRELRDMAYQKRSSLTDLLVDAVNDLFRKHGKTLIAEKSIQGRPRIKGKTNEGTYPNGERERMDG